MRSHGFTCGPKTHLPSLFHTKAVFATSISFALSSHPHARAFALRRPFMAHCAWFHPCPHTCPHVPRRWITRNTHKKKRDRECYENNPQMWPQLGNIFGLLLTATASCVCIGWKISIPFWPGRTKFCPHLPWVGLFFYFCSEPRAKCEL